MKRYADTFFRYWPLVLLPILILPLAALMMARDTPKTLVTSADIWVNQSTVSQIDGYNQWASAAQNEVGVLSQLLQTGMFNSSVINGSPTYRQLIAKSKTAGAYQQAVLDISTNLQVAPRGNNLINVSYTTKDWTLGVEVVNSFITSALNQAQELNQQTSSTVLTTYRTELHAAQQTLANDSVVLRKYLDRFNLQPSDIQTAQLTNPTLGTLSMQVQNDETTVTNLQKQINDAQIQAPTAQQQSPFRVVDGAGTTVKSSKKQLLLDVAIGLIAGLVLGGGFLVGRTFADRTLRFANDAAELLELPILTVIPYNLSAKGRKRLSQPAPRLALPSSSNIGNAR